MPKVPGVLLVILHKGFFDLCMKNDGLRSLCAGMEKMV